MQTTYGGITIGLIVSFLQLSKIFSRPIGQISQQLNSVVMALAGAHRIFALMDEEPEQDERLRNTCKCKICRRKTYRNRRKNRNVGLETSA